MESYKNESVFEQFCRAVQRENYPLAYKDAEADVSDFCWEFRERWRNPDYRKLGFNRVFNRLAKAYGYSTEVLEFKSENIAEMFRMLTTWGDDLGE